MQPDKEVKKRLRALRKLKKETQIHTAERRQINAQIREAKKVFVVREEELEGNPEKQQLIKELEELYQRKRRPMYVDFKVYTVEQLKTHLDRMTNKK